MSPPCATTSAHSSRPQSKHDSRASNQTKVLEAEADAGEGSAGAGFLPGEDDAVNDCDRRYDCNYPQHGGHAVEDAADDEKHQALRALHESDFAERDQRFGACARVADH